MVRFVLLVAACCALIVGASADAAGWSAKMTVPTHTPKARKAWPVKIVARSGGKNLKGTVQYHFIYKGQVVSTAGCIPTKPDPCPFNGTYKDVVRWPVRSAGIRLTFQATVKTKLGTKNLDWWVKVRR
ncbi:MAG TPA: hypothetical protein VGI67_09605 [Thermoleophilaceae bacterium]